MCSRAGGQLIEQCQHMGMRRWRQHLAIVAIKTDTDLILSAEIDKVWVIDHLYPARHSHLRIFLPTRHQIWAEGRGEYRLHAMGKKQAIDPDITGNHGF